MPPLPAIAPLTCFKAYDIRGRLGDELNVDIAYRIGRAYAQIFAPKRVAVGRDVRLSSEALAQAVMQGLQDAGVDVLDLGITGSEEVYFAVFHHHLEGGIEITGSHNPIDYNGLKIVKQHAVPVSLNSGLLEIKQLAESGRFIPSNPQGSTRPLNVLADYIDHLMSYVDIKSLKPLKLVANAGHGAAGHVIDALDDYFKLHHIPITFIKLFNEPDGTFPQGIPNPLLPDNRMATQKAVITHQADLGIAWDGDFDRCFFFDETGQFIEGYYIVGLLGAALLQNEPQAKIVYDARLTWNTQAMVEAAGGEAMISQSGHSFIKQKMRETGAIYGGEMSAHHYFKQFAYCDSGMIPWLLVCQLLSTRQQRLSALVNKQIKQFPCSGELNFKIEHGELLIKSLEQHYATQSHQAQISYLDGLSIEYPNWRFNIRLSNTEPLVRLNIEARGNDSAALLHTKINELTQLIQEFNP